MKISGKVAVVTGAASGIGKALALRFAREGARGVVCADLDETRARSVAAEAGGIGVRCDVAQEGDMNALVVAALVGGGGALAGNALYPAKPAPPAPPPVPAALADRPNVLLLVIDTLRADELSCYGGAVEAKALCGITDEDGTRFHAFSHASWTKPSFASILTSTLPSTHNTTSKTATLPPALELVSEALQNLPELLTMARIIPHINKDGQNEGFRIVSIKPDSFYQRIGLVNGDVLQQINGIEIKDPGTFMSVFNQLKNESSITVDLIRNNQKETLSYEIR